MPDWSLDKYSTIILLSLDRLFYWWIKGYHSCTKSQFLFLVQYEETEGKENESYMDQLRQYRRRSRIERKEKKGKETDAEYKKRD